MIYTEYTELTNCVLHLVGNKSEDEGVFLSEESIGLSDETSQILQKYLLGQVTTDGYSQFWHESSLELNDVYTFVKRIFEDISEFTQMSASIAKHLYSCSSHPKIKSGELCVVYFKNIIIDSITCDAVGLFKSENKDTFLRIVMNGNNSSIMTETGININKLDKAAIIFNTNSDSGYLATVIDRTNGVNEAKYWTEDFLKVKPCNNSFNQTERLLAMTRTFVAQLPEDGKKSEKALMVQRSMDAVKSSVIRVEDYAMDVFRDETIAQQFNEFTKTKVDIDGITFDDEIVISQQAVKKKMSSRLSMIKLDGNFDIKIHGGEQFIEQGYDHERGLKYYKLYYIKER